MGHATTWTLFFLSTQTVFLSVWTMSQCCVYDLIQRCKREQPIRNIPVAYKHHLLIPAFVRTVNWMFLATS